MNKIISINTGLNSSAGYFENGRPVFCIQEERLCREKNFGGLPDKSIDLIVKNYVSPKDVDRVVLTNDRSFVINKETYYNYYKTVFEDGIKLSEESTQIRNLKESIKKTAFYGLFRKNPEKKNGSEDLSWLVSKGFDLNKIVRVNHHLCHASAVYYGMGESLKGAYLIFSLDGGGDGLTSAIYHGKEGELTELKSSDCYSIGNMYSAITYFLGFNPHEHEYKLMGLAPYVRSSYAEKYKEFFTNFLKVDEDGNFYNPQPLNHSIFFSRLIKEFRKDRFDNIAAGIQLFCEDILLAWVQKNIEIHRVNNILCSGGVFMNVKSNLNLANLKGVERINVFPSCGDETNIFGAAFKTYNEETKDIGLLSKFTLGTDPLDDVDSALKKYEKDITAKKVRSVNSTIAKYLSENQIVARCSGPMEFGARALGNRSIFANPNNLSNVTKINRAIKKRDFWMPFAPMVLEEDFENYFVVPKARIAEKSPYMMFAFDSVMDKRDNIVCGLHQSDFTGRAQSIGKTRYPEIHDILTEFKGLTGLSVILNTSFNLHGFPIVNSSLDAIEVLLNSEIDVLFIGDNEIRRKS